jgi:hypothetical protein
VALERLRRHGLQIPHPDDRKRHKKSGARPRKHAYTGGGVAGGTHLTVLSPEPVRRRRESRVHISSKMASRWACGYQASGMPAVGHLFPQRWARFRPRKAWCTCLHPLQRPPDRVQFREVAHLRWQKLQTVLRVSSRHKPPDSSAAARRWRPLNRTPSIATSRLCIASAAPPRVLLSRSGTSGGNGIVGSALTVRRSEGAGGVALQGLEGLEAVAMFQSFFLGLLWSDFSAHSLARDGSECRHLPGIRCPSSRCRDQSATFLVDSPLGCMMFLGVSMQTKVSEGR